MSRSTVKLAETLVIHPTVPVPTHCGVCMLWNGMDDKPIMRTATRFAQWEDSCGPDNYIGVCDDCRMSGFEYIGTLEEFKAAQLRAMGLAEYEVYTKVGTVAQSGFKCPSRVDACARIRSLIRHGVSIDAIYQRSVSNGRLRKLNQDEQAMLVIEAMGM